MIEVEGRYIEDIGEVECKKCGCIVDAVYKYVKSNNSIQARCEECNAFIRNVKQVEKTNDELPTKSQLYTIEQFYKEKKIPKTKERAIQLIHILKKVSDDYEL